MQPKISKTLEGIIARAAFNTTKAGMSHSLKDFLALELLREEGSLAYQLLSSRLKDWELYQVRLRIEREVSAKQQDPTRTPEEFYRDFTEELLVIHPSPGAYRRPRPATAIISDRSTATARVLEMYGVTADSVSGTCKNSPWATTSAPKCRFTCSTSARRTGTRRKARPTCWTSSA